MRSSHAHASEDSAPFCPSNQLCSNLDQGCPTRLVIKNDFTCHQSIRNLSHESLNHQTPKVKKRDNRILLWLLAIWISWKLISKQSEKEMGLLMRVRTDKIGIEFKWQNNLSKHVYPSKFVYSISYYISDFHSAVF